MADRDDHRLFGDQILQIDVAEFFVGDLGPPGVAESSFDLLQVFLDDVVDSLLVAEDVQVVGDLREQFACARRPVSPVPG